jgi:hypothetical protein
MHLLCIEHAWDFIGRKINQRNPKCQNIDELRTVILQEWQQFPQERLRRFVRSFMNEIPFEDREYRARFVEHIRLGINETVHLRFRVINLGFKSC